MKKKKSLLILIVINLFVEISVRMTNSLILEKNKIHDIDVGPPDFCVQFLLCSKQWLLFQNHKPRQDNKQKK